MGPQDQGRSIASIDSETQACAYSGLSFTRGSLPEDFSGGRIDIDAVFVTGTAAVGVVNRFGFVCGRSPPAADIPEVAQFTLTGVYQFFGNLYENGLVLGQIVR